MNRLESGSLHSNLWRYAAGLIISIVLPMVGLLGYVHFGERRAENAIRDFSLYHLRTESLAREVRLNLTRLKGGAGGEGEAKAPASFSGREADARFQIRSAVDEITAIQRTFGSGRFASVVGRINDSWNQVEAELASGEAQRQGAGGASSLSVALLQLERLHQIKSGATIEKLRHHGVFGFARLAGAGLVVALISGVLVWKIILLMGRMARDIDERTVALRESETRFGQMADNIEAVFWIADVNTKASLFVSRGYEVIWGRPVSTLREDPGSWINAIDPRDRERVLNGLATIREGKIWKDEYRIERPDGSMRWIRDRGFPVKDDAGNVVRMAGVAADVTEEFRMQQNIRVSEEHLRSLMESAQGFVVYRNVSKHARERAGENVFVSPSIRDIVGVSDPGDFDSWFDNVHEEDLPRIVAAQRASTEDYLPFKEEMRIFHPGRHEWRWIRAISRPVHDSNTGQDYFNGIIIDITDEKRFQKELEQAIREIQTMKDLAEAENVYLREEIRMAHLHEDIIGRSDAMKSVMLEAERVAGTDATVLIQGETGTGKELVARAIHRMSKRSDQPLITINCAAMPATLMESELFGREKGAYTGAVNRQMGRFEAADGGTIFLDEIGELPEKTQAKLLRVLQDGQFERLGSTQTIRVNVRVIAATNRNLAEEVTKGAFREDLFYRLNVFPVTIPALRDRTEDIPMIARHFVKEFGEKMGKNVESISRNTLEGLRSYSWPGNVRELRNLIERGMILARGKTLRLDVAGETAGERIPLANRPLAEVEKDHILATLERTGWKIRGKGGAAEILGLPPSTLESRMKKRGIERPKTA